MAHGPEAGGELPAELRLRIRTAGGSTTVSAEFDRSHPAGLLLRAGVRGKHVRDLGPVDIPTAVGAAVR
ncbi:hypothetical protein GXW82_08810 [Streptacidiphilus sp. 4-A2]|nr:hypothetical protein [Streptacidiphilus sp. 4-A2]